MSCPTCAWRVFGKHHFPSAEAQRVSCLAVLAVPPKCAVMSALAAFWNHGYDETGCTNQTHNKQPNFWLRRRLRHTAMRTSLCLGWNCLTANLTLFHFIRHDNPMRRHCQITVKRSERRVDLTVAAEQQPCGVQVV